MLILASNPLTSRSGSRFKTDIDELSDLLLDLVWQSGTETPSQEQVNRIWMCIYIPYLASFRRAEMKWNLATGQMSKSQ